MPVVNRIADLAPRMGEWRRALHAIPEVAFDLPKTAAFVADRLREIGVDEIHEGIAQTGVVALIRGQGAGPVVGLRADMDALPMSEETGLPHASRHPGAMHACGHDGHTAMLLGAAAYLAETRAFAGTVALIFQPAEESGAGARVMVEAGVLDRFGIAEVYALHNMPGLPVGHFATAPGPVMAAVDDFEIEVVGRGGHGAYPQETADPLIAACAIAQAIQTIVSRNRDPLADLVVSVTQIHAGTTHNVIAETAMLGGTVRSFDPAVQAMVRDRLAGIAAGVAAGHGVTARLHYREACPVTVNDPGRTAFAAGVAAAIGPTDAAIRREMGAEDFSFMLQARPGAYVLVGNGDSARLHNPRYDFNDAALPWGASFLARLAEAALPLRAGGR